MRSILALSIIDAQGVALDFLSAAEGAFAIEQSAYEFRVLLPLAVGHALGLDELDAISMAKRARLSSAQVGDDERVVRLVLLSPRAFSDSLASRCWDQLGLLEKLEQKAKASLFSSKVLFEDDTESLGNNWLATLGFKSVYALLEKRQMDRCAERPTQSGPSGSDRLRL